MATASAWYRKQTRWFLFLAGIVLAGALNVDAVHAATTLYRDDQARAAVGEYLIMLPQQLEVLVPEDSDPDADTPAARWLDKTASAVAEALASKVLSLPKLGAQVCCCLKLANRQIGKVGKINKVHVNKLVDVDAFFAECNVADTSVRSPAKRNFVYCTSKGGSLGESAM